MPHTIGLIKAGHLSIDQMLRRQALPMYRSSRLLRMSFAIALSLAWSLLFYVSPELVYLSLFSRVSTLAMQFRGFGCLVYGIIAGLLTYGACASIGWLEHHPTFFGLAYFGGFIAWWVLMGNRLILGTEKKAV